MATQITATLPTLDFPREVDYPTQEDWAAFSAAAEENFGILGGSWSAQMQLWKTEANAMSTELNTNSTIAQGLANYQGDWTSKGYTLGQTVSVSGVYYICKLTHASGQNPTAGGSIYWNLALGNWSLKVDTNMSGYTAKSTPTDSDLIPLSDSVSSFGIKKLTWANLKANLNTGFKNLIVNGNKQVNQSGLTTTDNAYNYDNHYKVGNNWFMFVNGKNIVSGKPYTLSWDGVATAGYYIGTAGALTINAQTFTPITNGTTITPTITSSQKLWIKFSTDASGSTYNKVQLEPGTVPTLFEHRIYELEESFVQRVYEHGIISTFVLSANTTYKGGINNAYFKTTKDIIPQVVITTNNGSKNAYIWAVDTNVVQFTPTIQSVANDFINVVANIDARPY